MKSHIQKESTIIDSFVFYKHNEWGKIQINFVAHDDNHDDAFMIRTTTEEKQIIAATTGLQGRRIESFCGFNIRNIKECSTDIRLEIFWEGENQQKAIIESFEAILKELKKVKKGT
jgi:hypothetical protein